MYPGELTSRNSNVAGEFDRSDVSAILRRALEVAHQRHPDEDEKLGVEDLASIADDVGLSRSALVTALAESRAGVDHRIGVTDRLVGPRQVWAISQLSHDEPTATATLQQWLRVNHGLRAYVGSDGVVRAEPRSGLAAAINSGLRKLQGTGGLDRVRSVHAATASVEDTRSICVLADISNKRNEAITGGSAVAGSSMVAVGLVGLLVTPLAFAALPVGVVVGVVTARLVHRQTTNQVAGQIEFTAEAVVRDQRPVHPVDRIIQSRLFKRRPSFDQ
jgi:hypothetical protein